MSDFVIIHTLNYGRSTVARFLDSALTWALRFIDSFFAAPGIRGVDLGLSLIAGGWVWSIAHNPVTMERLTYAGLSFMTRQASVGVFALLAVVHLISYLNPHARFWRVFWLGVSSWVWAVIGSFMAWAVTTGGVTYLVVGFVAFIGAIYVERSHR
ncbi:hypothetical protein [Methylopila sp. 73B]|uniref:hypothetical protein n=1 Tax=Methylopila sp. 73B TaxID=1120792 RepID=UPI000369B881|nr:hypothetical protein [Methylopila sp. 73B]